MPRSLPERRGWAVALGALGLILAGAGHTTAIGGVGVGVVATAASVASWSQAERDARHSATALVAGPQTGHVRWARRLDDALSGGASLGRDGTVYVSANDGVLHALDPATGRDRWRFAPGGDYGAGDTSASPAVLRNGTVLWSGPGNALYAVSERGHERWRVPFTAFVLSPAIVGRTAYVNDMRGVLRAIDVGGALPRVRWTLARTGRGESYASPAVGPEGTIYTTIDRDLVAVRDGGGHASVRWRFSAKDIIEVSPAVAADGTVVLGTNDAYQYGFSPAGKLRWRYPRNSYTYSSPAVDGRGRAYFGDHLGYLNVLDARSGALIVRDHVAGQIWTAPAIDSAADVYFGTHSGHVYGFSATGRLLFDLPTRGSVESYPALDRQGVLYIGSEDGHLYAIDR